MFSEKERIRNYLKLSIEELRLIAKMSAPITKADDFGLNLNGMTVLRACSMSLQYITENFIQIRNRVTEQFFAPYSQVPWKGVFGMRNFLAHEYADVDSEAIFHTIRMDMPVLLETAELMLRDLESGLLDGYINRK